MASYTIDGFIYPLIRPAISWGWVGIVPLDSHYFLEGFLNLPKSRGRYKFGIAVRSFGVSWPAVGRVKR